MSKPLKKKSIFSIVVDVIFSLFMVFMGVIVVNSIVEKSSGKSMFGSHIVWVYTGSMEPTIHEQSYIYTKDVKPEDIVESDIITFIVEDPDSPINGKLNTHRVIRIVGDDYYTKGDANPAEDGVPTHSKNIVAKYERNLPVLTFFKRLYQTPAGYVITMVLIVGLLTLWFAIDHKEKVKKEKREEFDKLVQEEVKRLEQEAKNK